MFHIPRRVFLALISFAGVPHTGTKHSSRNFCSAGINSSKSTPRPMVDLLTQAMVGMTFLSKSALICFRRIAMLLPLDLRGRHPRAGNGAASVPLLQPRDAQIFLVSVSSEGSG